MSPKTLLATWIAAALALTACTGSAPSNGLPPDLPVAETVNGQAVPEVLVNAIAAGRKLDLAVPEQRAQAIRELTDYVLLAQAAASENYLKDPAFAAEVELYRLQGMANATMLKFQEGTRVDDSVLRTEYDKQIEKAGKVDFSFTQLLFEKEDDALAAAGAAISKPFTEVYASWQARAKQAQSYEHVRKAQVPEALANALAGLKVGETVKVPVKTEFGWHVVHLDASAPLQVAPFEQVKDSIRTSLLARLAQQRLDKLRNEATVTVASSSPAATSASKTEPADKPTAD